MKERQAVRYGTQRLPKQLRKATVSWGISSIETDIDNFCTQGMKVTIPPKQSPVGIPQKGQIVKVNLSIVNVSLTGMCIYTANELDGTISMGINYDVPVN